LLDRLPGVTRSRKLRMDVFSGVVAVVAMCLARWRFVFGRCCCCCCWDVDVDDDGPGLLNVCARLDLRRPSIVADGEVTVRLLPAVEMGYDPAAANGVAKGTRICANVRIKRKPMV
jgi:hypothetical protein